MKPRFFFALVTLGLLGWVPVHAAGLPRAVPPGESVPDVRLQPLKDLDGYFPFQVPASAEAWGRRSDWVRRRLLVSLGLWPMPPRTPLNPVIHGAVDQGDYTVEKVFFESAPGFFVTGNLYRPKGASGRVPGILCPHGHWPDGRFMDTGEDGIRKQLSQGAERFEEGGRSPLQARCVQLARMGCVVFHYDMVGYADSIQISQALAHGFSKQRPEMNTLEDWGLFSPQAETHLQSVMMLQTWNSIRALDFLLGLPGVDASRVGCTGASGGGTQTFILAGIDPRLNVDFPAVMVGTAMQGGCTCENASLLRVETGNVEIAGLFAPKPMGMTSANDWTKETATKGLPELKALYAMLGAPENVSLRRAEWFDHNYNHVSRTAMYAWMNRHLNLGLKEPVLERDYRRLGRDQLSVWDEAHPKPSAGDAAFEQRLLRWFHEQAETALSRTAATGSLTTLHRPAVELLVGRPYSEVGVPEWNLRSKVDQGRWLEMAGLILQKDRGEAVPAVFLHPKQWNGVTTLWLGSRGKASLFQADGTPIPEVLRLVEKGQTVAGLDLFGEGEFLPDGAALERTDRVKNPREAAAFTFGYNHAVFARRVHDLMSAVKLARTYERSSKRVDVVAFEGTTGPIAAAARALCGDAIDRLALNTRGFRFGRLKEIHSPDFLPGGAKYGDLPMLVALGAPYSTWVTGEDAESAALLKSRFARSGAPDSALVVAPSGAALEDAMAYLLAD